MMFEILILNCINNGQENIYHLPENVQIFIEVAHSLNTEYSQQKLFVNFFNHQKLTWDIKNINIIENGDDRYVMVSKYLQADKTQQYDISFLNNKTVTLNKNVCLELIHHYYSRSGQSSPNYYTINAFVAFLHNQLINLQGSPFFQPRELEDQFPGEGTKLFGSIVKNLIQLALNLSQVRVASGIQSSQLQSSDLASTQAERLQVLSSSDNLINFILISDKGSIIPIYKDVKDIPASISALCSQYEPTLGKLQSFKEMEQIILVDKIFEMCLPDSEIEFVKYKLLSDDQLYRIVFTKDNFAKLAQIFIRIQANQPVILMGETGVGKSAIIHYLADVLDATFNHLDIHAGIEEEAIIDWILAENKRAKVDLDQGNLKQHVILLDEINTNDNISGLLKEIMIDRHIQGESLCSNIRLIAACNPYKFKPKNLNTGTAGIKIKQQNQESSNLVYMVKPLPESMMCYIWDYGSLGEKEEKQYIRKILEKENFDKIEQKPIFDDKELELLTKYIVLSQKFTRKIEANWAVSLRDVARFCKLLVFFVKNNITSDQQSQKQGYFQWKKEFNQYQRATVLALCFCYIYRINQKDDRLLYIQKITSIFTGCKRLKLSSDEFLQILQEEQSRYLNYMQIPRGIGKNNSLKENIFVIITCILNKIPLIISGKPGSSKTLAMNLVAKSMKGESSIDEFFKKFPSVQTFYYQGSIQSTSRGIERNFEKAEKFQVDIKDQNIIALVNIDEIGLAEVSPHNPLKVLHSWLEHPKVAFVGLSNQSLDASKMNRVISLSRPDPSDDDLQESGISISEEMNKSQPKIHDIFKGFILDKLVSAYSSYFRGQQVDNFHGLRDFYALVQYVCSNIGEDETQNKKIILKALQRNFGGQDVDYMLQCFDRLLHLNFDNHSLVDTKSLIYDNLNDYNSRNLMIISENFENTILTLEEKFRGSKCQYQVFYGSEFVEDKNEQASYKQIHDIILCMESGIIVILLNLESIYQSFYDMLNQNYQYIGHQRFCKVAIGPDSSRCLVHDNFKCVLIVSQDQVNHHDAPLLNRFEKQIFSDTNMEIKYSDIISILKKWLKEISKVGQFRIKDMFPTLNSNNLIQLVGTSLDIDENKIIQKCKYKLLQLATYQGILRSSKSEAQDKAECQNVYMVQQSHQSLSHFINNQIISAENNNEEQSSLIDTYSSNQLQIRSTTACLNYIIYTYSSFMTDISQQHNCQVMILGGIYSKQDFIKRIASFLSNQGQNQLIIFADSRQDSVSKINLCRSIINTERIKSGNEQVQCGFQKYIIILIRIDGQINESIPFSEGWDQIMIDTQNGSGLSQNLTVDIINNSSLNDILMNNDIWDEIIQMSLAPAVSQIKSYDNQDDLILHVEKIRRTITKPDYKLLIRELILAMVKKNKNLEDGSYNWIDEIVENQQIIETYISFHSSVLGYLTKMIEKYLAFVVFYLQSSNMLNGIGNDQMKLYAFKHFEEQFYQYFIHLNLQEIYNIPIAQTMISYPFAKEHHDRFMDQRQQYIALARQREVLEEQQQEDQNQERDMEDETEVDQNEEPKMSQDNLLVDQQSNNENFYLTQDKELQGLSAAFKAQCEAIFPSSLIQNNIYCIDTEIYLQHFSSLINPQVYDSQFESFIYRCLKIIKNDSEYASLFELYSIYFKYELPMVQIYQMIVALSGILSSDQFMEALLRMLNQHENCFQEGIVYVPRQAFVEESIDIICQVSIPSDININQIESSGISWADNAKANFDRMSDLSQQYLGEFYTSQSQKIKFLIDYNAEVLTPLSLGQEYLIQVANYCKEDLDLVKIALTLKDQGIQVAESRDPEEQEKVRLVYGAYIYSIIGLGIGQFDEDIGTDEIDLVELLLDMIIEEFQRNLQGQTQMIQWHTKLLKQVISVIHQNDEDIFMNVISEDANRFKELLKEEHILKCISKFVIRHVGYDYDHPFVVMLCDSIQHIFLKAWSNIIEDEEETQKCLSSTLDILTDIDRPILQRLIAVAYFKTVVQIFCHSIENQRQDIKSFEDVFNDKFMGGDREKYKPFMLYIVKMLNQKLDIYQIARQASQYIPWVQQLRLQNDEQQFQYDVQLSQDLSQKYAGSLMPQNNEAISNITNNEQNQMISQFCLLSTLLELGIFSKNLLNLDIQQLSQSAKLSQEAFNYVQTYFADNKQGAHQTLNIDENNDIKKYQILTSFIGCGVVTSLKDSFISTIYNDPAKISQIFLPFQINVKDDIMYHHVLHSQNKNGQPIDGITRYSCKNCGQIFVVTDCGELSNERNDYLNQGGSNPGSMKCEACGMMVGFGAAENSIKLGAKIPKAQFSTDSEAVKGYIVKDGSDLNNLTIRKMNETQYRFGELIVTAILQMSLVFGDQQQQDGIVKMMNQNMGSNGALIFDSVRAVLDFFVTKIVCCWKRIQEIENLTDEKMQKLCQYISMELWTLSQQQANNFKFNKLLTIEGRKQFEQDFINLCLPDSQGQFQEFFKSFKMPETANQIYLKHINEQINLLEVTNKQEYLYSLLRMQDFVSLDKFKQHIKPLKQDAPKFIKLVFEQEGQLSKIKQIIPIINWANYVLDKWSGKLTIEDSMDLSIMQVLSRDASNYEKAKSLFTKCQEAVKQFEGQFLSLGCEDIYFLKLELDDRFQQCCITNTKKDSLGYRMYCLLKYLCDIQNQFVSDAAQISQFENLKKLEKEKVPILSLTKQQVIIEDFKEEPDNDDDADDGENNFQYIVSSNSYSDLEYGKGKTNYYILDDISKIFQEELLDRKVMIDFEKDINFQYANVGNLATQYNDIMQSTPQEKYPGAQNTVQNLRTNNEVMQFMGEMKTAINFLSQIKSDPNNQLTQFLTAFGIKHFHHEIGDGAKLCHVINFYEAAEDRMMDILVEKTNPKYKEDLSPHVKDQLDLVVKKQEKDLELVIKALGRLCIRQLSYNQELSNSISLFQILFSDFNLYLFSLQAEVNLEQLNEAFISCEANLGQAYCVYKYLCDILAQRQQSHHELEQERRLNQMINEAKIKKQQLVQEDQSSFNNMWQGANANATAGHVQKPTSSYLGMPLPVSSKGGNKNAKKNTSKAGKTLKKAEI